MHLSNTEALGTACISTEGNSEFAIGCDCPAELLEEEMCDEERYKDMHDLRRLERKVMKLICTNYHMNSLKVLLLYRLKISCVDTDIFKWN